jgi:hypothetical protein
LRTDGATILSAVKIFLDLLEMLSGIPERGWVPRHRAVCSREVGIAGRD